MKPASLQSTANDGGDALSTYLAATLYCDGACSAVRIRNIAATGALVEGGPEPSAGTLVQLVRGELIVHGLVAWSAEAQFGLKFSGCIDVQEWLAAPGNRHQQWVDGVVDLVKAGAVPFPVASAGRSEDEGKCVSTADLAGDLARASELIGNLGEVLANDVDVVTRHGEALQTLDIAKQIVDAVQTSLGAQTAAAAQAVRLAGLRRSAEQALLKGV